MKFAAAFFFRLRWLNMPGAVLMVMLQRTPVLRLFVAAEEAVTSSPIAAVLKSTAATIASLGAIHSLAGATTLQIQQSSVVYVQFGNPPRLNSPIPLTVGTPIAPILVFVNGALTPAGSYQFTGLPPGITAQGANANGIVNASSVVLQGTATQAGTFNATVLAWEFPNGPSTPANDRFPETGPLSFTFTVTGTANTAPTITTQPQGRVVAPGQSASFTVAVSGSPTPTLQWQRNGTPITGATAATLTLTNVQAGDAGDYRVVATNAAGSVTSNTATLSVSGGGSSTGRLSNLSVRTSMTAGQLLTVGVVVSGGSRNVLVRAVGPGLANFGLTNAMADPKLDLFNGSTLVTSNNDWIASLAPTFASVGAFALTTGSKDAALVQAVDGARTIQATGTGAGVVLVEAYDTGDPTAAHLINVSARNRVGTGDDILIAGFTIAGSGSKPLLIRAVGPTLGTLGVGGVLANPRLELYNGATKIGENEDWDASQSATFTAVGAFALTNGSKDAALITSLTPGSYTVQVRGSDGGTGEALVEIYEIP